ncbi:bifunctional DNA primase/polymerase [Acidocella sp.]|uniref:bifunctional DNA primase/polymerase n=1 Tax=Acidocella sp. TaxID=50710 RepID=UPI002637919E|nr:bifunctional DNA primase/polymerase [Acidocella sp.]
MTALQHALDLATKGRAVFPMTEAKRPACEHGVRDATRDPAQIRAWFSRPGLLPAIATGEPSGVVVLDLDRQHGAANWWRDNRHRLPETEAYRTRSGGLHLMFTYRPGIRTLALDKIGPGVELRSTGASAIDWRAAGFQSLCDAAPAELPPSMLPPPPPPPAPASVPVFTGETAARRYAEAAMTRAIQDVASAPPGTRNAALNSATYSLLRLVEAGAVTAREIAGAMAHAGGAAGLPPREIEATLASALRARGGAA